MNIKNKLRLGIGFLFLMALISSGLADYYLTRLSNDSKAILKDNYRSLVYVRDIEMALDNQKASNKAKLTIIGDNIAKEELNITERGEKQLADSLRTTFEQYKTAIDDQAKSQASIHQIREQLYGILQLNMAAIEHKNTTASTTAS